MDTTITKRDLLSELARRSHLAQEIGNWHASETYVAAWHRVHAEPEPTASGQHGCRCLCLRCTAARYAAVPLDQRLSRAFQRVQAREEASASGATAPRHTH